jgi:hypothetical protein
LRMIKLGLLCLYPQSKGPFEYRGAHFIKARIISIAIESADS